MKLFAAMCGTTAVMTSAVSIYILSRFDAFYGKSYASLPFLTQAVLWKGGFFPPTLLLISAIMVFTGLGLKDKSLMITGGVATLLLMLGAATIVPAALMLPMEKLVHGEPGIMQPAPPKAPVERQPLHD